MDGSFCIENPYRKRMSTKYNFQQKKAISRRIADISYIDRYRQLLKAVKSPAAGRKMLDKQQLAVSLVYELLAYYSAAQLAELTVKSETEKPAAASSLRSVTSVKKSLEIRAVSTYPVARYGRPSCPDCGQHIH